MKEYSSYDFNWNTFQIHWLKKNWIMELDANIYEHHCFY